jgi:hypothetical protein
MERYKAVTANKIEQLEIALIETKLRMNAEREMAEMRVAEMESYQLNMAPVQKYVDELVQ